MEKISIKLVWKSNTAINVSCVMKTLVLYICWGVLGCSSYLQQVLCWFQYYCRILILLGAYNEVTGHLINNRIFQNFNWFTAVSFSTWNFMSFVTVFFTYWCNSLYGHSLRIYHSYLLSVFYQFSVISVTFIPLALYAVLYVYFCIIPRFPEVIYTPLINVLCSWVRTTEAAEDVLLQKCLLKSCWIIDTG
jgi:hypothetical protein